MHSTSVPRKLIRWPWMWSYSTDRTSKGSGPARIYLGKAAPAQPTWSPLMRRWLAPGDNKKSVDAVSLQQTLWSLLSHEAFCWRSCQDKCTCHYVKNQLGGWAQRVVMNGTDISGVKNNASLEELQEVRKELWNRSWLMHETGFTSLKERTLNKGLPGLLYPVQVWGLSAELSAPAAPCCYLAGATEPHALCIARDQCQFTASWPQAPLGLRLPWTGAQSATAHQDNRVKGNLVGGTLTFDLWIKKLTGWKEEQDWVCRPSKRIVQPIEHRILINMRTR